MPSLFLVTAVSSLVEARAGRPAEAEADRLLTRRHLERFGRLAPWANLQARVALARASLLLGEPAAGRALLDECDDFLALVPDAVRVRRQLAEVRAALAREVGVSGPPPVLTVAELRVLRYLPSHLTLAEIAERLYVSRNTVKTQAIAVYRKLGTRSRASAVDVAAEAGLLDDT
jgi:LuxR family maltose regulon positive regulatory protein